MSADLKPEDAKGTCVFVGDEIVAWFKVFDYEAELWCTTNHFGEWVTWRATAPIPVPLTKEESELAQARAREMLAKLRFE